MGLKGGGVVKKIQTSDCRFVFYHWKYSGFSATFFSLLEGNDKNFLPKPRS